jgi:hypothetical protein
MRSIDLPPLRLPRRRRASPSSPDRPRGRMFARPRTPAGGHPIWEFWFAMAPKAAPVGQRPAGHISTRRNTGKVFPLNWVRILGSGSRPTTSPSSMTHTPQREFVVRGVRDGNSGSAPRHRDVTYGKEDQGEAISAKPFPERTAADVKGNDRRRQIHSARALPACQATGETSKWIGERDYRLMKSGPSATTLRFHAIYRSRAANDRMRPLQLNKTVLVAPA